MPEKDMSPNEELREIQRQVNRFSPRYIDRDDISSELWLEINKKSIPPYVSLIKHRCIDAIRARTRRIEAEQAAVKASYKKSGSKSDRLTSSDKQDVSDLICRAGLTGDERILIYKYFYQGKSLSEISIELHRTKHMTENIKKMALEKLKRVARFFERKE